MSDVVIELSVLEAKKMSVSVQQAVDALSKQISDFEYFSSDVFSVEILKAREGILL